MNPKWSVSMAPIRLHLHASVVTLQACLESLEVHIPWDTPVTAPWRAFNTSLQCGGFTPPQRVYAQNDAQAPPPSDGPYLMSTMPQNGSTEVSTSDFQAAQLQWEMSRRRLVQRQQGMHSCAGRCCLPSTTGCKPARGISTLWKLS